MKNYQANYHTNDFWNRGQEMGYAQGEYSGEPFALPEDLKDVDSGAPTVATVAPSRVASEVFESAVGLGGKLLERGKSLLQSNVIGEGPKPLRAFCFVGGIMMIIASFFGVINIFSFFTGPSTYVLQVYQLLFGSITLITEAKDADVLSSFKPFMHEWFRFLTVPGGKGAFYLFTGTVGVSLWDSSSLDCLVGLYMVCCGLVCIFVHISLKSQLRRGANLPDMEEGEDDI